jgi:hypothetical protein
LYGAESGTLQKVDQKYLERWKCCVCGRMQISLTYHMRYEEVLQRVEEDKIILQTIKRRKITVLVTSCIGTAVKNTLLKER